MVRFTPSAHAHPLARHGGGQWAPRGSAHHRLAANGRAATEVLDALLEGTQAHGAFYRNYAQTAAGRVRFHPRDPRARILVSPDTSPRASRPGRLRTYGPFSRGPDRGVSRPNGGWSDARACASVRPECGVRLCSRPHGCSLQYPNNQLAFPEPGQTRTGSVG